MMWLFFWCGCTSETTRPPLNSQSDTNTTEEDTAQEIVSEQPDDTGLVCVAGTVPIPTENPQYCIMECEANILDHQAISMVGEYPASNVSFYVAKEVCRNTWVAEAETFMRLATFEEWLDAGDGVYGEGGSIYPWGDSIHNGACVLSDGNTSWDEWQVCGSLPSCQSRFGVWDQIGNLWEWVDTGNTVDIDHWFAAREADGINVDIQDGLLSLSEGNLASFIPFVVGLSFPEFTYEDGIVHVLVDQPFREDLPGEGYLMPTTIQGIATSEDMLPIRLRWNEVRLRAVIEVIQARDGEPIPAKVGGAYYSGSDVRLKTIFWGHVPSFDGSIGFRCVYDRED